MRAAVMRRRLFDAAVVMTVVVAVGVSAYTPPSGAVSAQNIKVAADGSIHMPMDWFPSMRVVNTDARYAEGANMMPNGELWYAEYSSHKVRAYNPATKHTRTVWDPATLSSADRAKVLGLATDNPKAVCGTSAVMLWAEQHAYVVTCYDANTVVLLDVNAPHTVRHVFKGPTTTTTTTTTTGTGTAGQQLQVQQKWNGPNDVVSDGHGGIFVSCSGPFVNVDSAHPPVGCVYHIAADGQEVTRVTPCDLAYPNGLVMLPPYVYGMEHVLLVAEHLRNRVLAYDVMLDHDGGRVTLTNQRVWSDLSVEAPLNDPARDARAQGPHVPVPDDAHYPTHVLWNRTAPSPQEGGWAQLRLGPNGMKYHAQLLDVAADGRVLPKGQYQERHWIYVAQHGGGRILKMDATNGRVLSEIVLPTRWASNLALDGRNGVVYACSVTLYTEPYPGKIFHIRDPHLKAPVSAAPASAHPIHAVHGPGDTTQAHAHDQHGHGHGHGRGTTTATGQSGPNIHHEHDHDDEQLKTQRAAAAAAEALKRPPIHIEL